MMCLILLTHIPALFMTSLTQTADHKMAALRVDFLGYFHTSILKKQDEIATENLLWVFIIIFIFFFLSIGFVMRLR